MAFSLRQLVFAFSLSICFSHGKPIENDKIPENPGTSSELVMGQNVDKKPIDNDKLHENRGTGSELVMGSPPGTGIGMIILVLLIWFICQRCSSLSWCCCCCCNCN